MADKPPVKRKRTPRDLQVNDLDRAPVSEKTYAQPDWLRDMQQGRANHRPESRLSEGELTTLRYAAGMHYASDMNGCTLGDMKRMPVFSALKLKTLEQWCDQDKWIERRHANLAEWRGLIEQRIGESIVQSRLNDLKELEDLKARTHSLLNRVDNRGHPLIRPKSFEGMVNAIGKLTERIDSYRTAIASAVAPEDTNKKKKEQAQLSAPTEGMLSMEEMRDVAHQMLRKKHDPTKPKTSAAEEAQQHAATPQEPGAES